MICVLYKLWSVFTIKLWQSCQQPVSRQWNFIMDARNYPCVMLTGFDLRYVTFNHMFQYTWFLELKYTSTGYTAELVCVTRFVSNSYVILELRSSGLFLLRHCHYSLRNYPFGRSSAHRSYTTVLLYFGPEAWNQAHPQTILHDLWPHTPFVLHIYIYIYIYIYQFPAPWRVEWQPIVCRLWSKDRFLRTGETKTRYAVLRVQCDHGKIKWT
jgi:hypothetical protein